MQHSTGIFKRELLPPPRAFYQRELGKLSRPSRGWARANCPFHESKSKTSFSVNLDTGGFYCHGCQVHGGDVVAFMRLRYKLDFKTAAMQVGAWDANGSTPTAQVIRQDQRDRERRQAQREADEEAARQERINVRDQLHTLERIYRRANEHLCEVRHTRTEKHPGECDLLWGFLADTLPQIRTAAAQYRQLAGVGDGD